MQWFIYVFCIKDFGVTLCIFEGEYVIFSNVFIFQFEQKTKYDILHMLLILLNRCWKKKT